MTTYLITGGAGFMGSNFIRFLLNTYPDFKVINLDKLTYAGNLENLKDIENDPRYRFVKGDICDLQVVEPLVEESDVVVNFAAETHVDRSVMEAGSFVLTDVYGSYILLQAARKYGIDRFIQISTDEVYGSIKEDSFSESDPLHPSNPYSASKAGGENLVYSFYKTYSMPIIITRATNNFGPYQYPEKVIPLFITNALDGLQLPLYGDGMQVRDWLYVEDHSLALDFIIREGKVGEVYNIAGGNEIVNLELTHQILAILGKPTSLINHVEDRPGHDRRYSLNCEKLKSLGWKPKYSFPQALRSTVQWYLNNQQWWRKIKERDERYKSYYRQQYGKI